MLDSPDRWAGFERRGCLGFFCLWDVSPYVEKNEPRLEMLSFFLLEGKIIVIETTLCGNFYFTFTFHSCVLSTTVAQAVVGIITWVSVFFS